MTGATSRAVLFDRYGGREVLYVADVPMPTPAPNEVVVEVRAAGINPGETAIRSGALDDRFPATFPSGEGSDLAGLVTALGSGVEDFAVGDAVLGFSWRRSSHATNVAVPTSQLIRKPPELSWEVAGGLYVVGCTAYAAVRAVGVKEGDTVAVSAAAGGVGTVVVQSVGPPWCVCARHCLASARRLAPFAWRRAGSLWRRPGRAPAGGSGSDRRVHRSLWAGVRRARHQARHSP